MRGGRKKQKIIYLLIGLLLIMGVGYSAFSSSLKITGNTKITSDWDVEITGISAATINGSAEEVSTPTYDKLSANMEVNLYESGDSVEYDVTISNLGSIDATLDDYFLGTTTEAIQVSFSNFTKGEILYKYGHSNSTKNIHVKIEYNPSYTGGEVSEETSITFNFKQPEVKELTNDEVVSKDKYLVTYDCQTNGGASCTSLNEYLLPGENVDLTKTPNVPGYDFIGWNTNSSESIGLSSYTMPSSNVTLYAILEVQDQTPPVIDTVSTTKTSTSITVIATAHDDDTGITKYEFSSDDGDHWVDNDTSGMYTFTGLTMGQTYNITVRVTNGANGKTTSETYNVTPDLSKATFQEITGSTTQVEITYPEECSDGTYTCSYQKDSGSEITVDNNNLTNNSIYIEFTTSGTLIAKVSDGTNTVSSSYTVTYVQGTIPAEETYTTAGSTTFTAPVSGEYFLQVWGAQGGSYDSSHTGGKGGYSYGTITLNKDDVLYIYTGGQPTEYNSSATSGNTNAGGFNGGGAGRTYSNSETTTYSLGGGGASDIRVNSNSLYARVIVAGGGSGSSNQGDGYAGGGTQGLGYNNNMKGKETSAGTGGSFGTGGSSTGTYSYKYGPPGGGGGWYGGGRIGSASNSNSYYGYYAGGGSGYVYTSATASNYPSGCLLSSDYYLDDARTIAGDGTESFESPSGGTETGHSGDGYAKISYDTQGTINDKIALSVNSVTTNSVSVTATPKSGLTVTKYEFLSDGGSTWINNGTNGTYNFTALTHNTNYTLKARITTQDGKVVGSINVKTHEIVSPTFNDVDANNSINSTITYPSGCGSTYTCTYIKNSNSPVTVTSTSETVNFTSAGTLTATVSDGTNTVTETHEVTENATLSFSTSKTTNSITITDTVTSSSGVSKYEFQLDGGNWVESVNNVYTFTNLSNTTTHTVNSRITTNFGTVKTGTSSNVTLDSIELPTYSIEYHAVDDGDVTITYPSGCGSTYTCTYTKNSASPVTVISTTQVVNFSANGELAASISDGTNTVSNSYTVTMPIDIIDDYGVNMLVTDSGEGLYESSETTDDTAYFYRGANPNNYILLGEDLYRIMSIDSSGNFKVIKDTQIMNLPWDPGYSTTLTGITSSSSTAGTRYSSSSTNYCYSSSSSKYYGCKAWGSSTSTLNSTGTSSITQMPWEVGSSTLKNLPTYDSYMNVYLNGGTYPTSSGTKTVTSWYSNNVDSDVQSKMVDHLWNVGPLRDYRDDTLSQNIAQEAEYKWSGKVGLMTATEYVRASTNPSCSTVRDYENNSLCYDDSSTHNWLYKEISQHTMSPYSGTESSHVWVAESAENSLQDNLYYKTAGTASNTSLGARPVFYLSSDITLIGSGTKAEPYYIYKEPTNDAKSTLTKLGQTAKAPYTNDGDGVYEGNDGGYYYRGTNPNNYITLGSDTYRIVSIDSSGNLKVIKNTGFSVGVWDPGYTTNISGITSSSSTSGTRYSSSSSDYCYASSASSYTGCKPWGSKTSTLNSAGTRVATQMPLGATGGLKSLSTYDSYTNVYLNGGTYPTSSGTTTLTSWYSTNVNSSVQSKMVDHLWNVGFVALEGDELLAQNIYKEANYKWSGKVGLITASEYVRASTNASCTNVYSYENNSACYNNSSTHNWLYNNSLQRLMSPYSSSVISRIWAISTSGYLNYSDSTSTSYNVRPVFYLSSNVTISGGGTSGNAFTIS